MDFDEYQARAKDTAVYPLEHRLVYPALGLAGEAGELCNKLKKVLRGDYAGEMPDAVKEALVYELGDCLWYLSAAATDLGVPLAEVASRNLAKLAVRRRDGTVRGEGDAR